MIPRTFNCTLTNNSNNNKFATLLDKAVYVHRTELARKLLCLQIARQSRTHFGDCYKELFAIPPIIESKAVQLQDVMTPDYG